MRISDWSSDVCSSDLEAQLESEWSDGLPIVPPTPAAVEKFIHCSGRDAADFLGEFPPRQTRVTVKDVAVNAIMAGCKPQYAPTVIALTRALMDEEYRSEEHTSELQSLMRSSYAVFCLKKKNKRMQITQYKQVHIRCMKQSYTI